MAWLAYNNQLAEKKKKKKSLLAGELQDAVYK